MGVVKGVRYLHSCDIAHGEVRGVSPLTIAEDPVVKIIMFPAKHPHFGL